VMIHEQFDLLFTKNRYIFEKNIKKCYLIIGYFVE